jgi:hypothetical protein
MPNASPAAASFFSRLFAPELRAWRGEHRLGVVFWGYGVLASFGLILVLGAAIILGQLALQQMLLVVGALYTGWILVAIWRCAARAHPYWSVLARSLTIAWALNSLLVLLFLQLELLRRYLG